MRYIACKPFEVACVFLCTDAVPSVQEMQSPCCVQNVNLAEFAGARNSPININQYNVHTSVTEHNHKTVLYSLPI